MNVVPSDKLVPVGFFERWAEREQRRTERENADVPGGDWTARMDEHTPGPDWAWKLAAVPVVGIFGEVAILVDTWLRRYRGRGL